MTTHLKSDNNNYIINKLYHKVVMRVWFDDKNEYYYFIILY